MKETWKKGMTAGCVLLLAFVLWTVLVVTVDVQPAGQNGTNIGLAGINTRFHELTGVHLSFYELTDKLELIAIAVCAAFGLLGLIQLIRGKSLKKVDTDIILLGIYYIIVILAYFFFEKVVVNYRPVLIDGALEASYPSSTTLLVLSVMPTLIFQTNRRVKDRRIQAAVYILTVLFTAFVAAGRLVSGVHWLSDIIGAVLLSAGLYLVYRSAVVRADQKKQRQ